MKNTGRPINPADPNAKYVSRYLNTPNTPLYPFGYGLSYTSFSYSPVTLDRAKIRPGETLTASVTVTNSGAREGRSEEHTSELQSLMRISYAVFCLKKKKKVET